jgi:Skp family chaperone for outer membrane proteins
MEIRVIDFDTLTKNYTKYQEGILNLSKVRNSFIDRIDPIKKEMQSIINTANSGLVVDRATQEQNNAKFTELQEEAMNIDNEYKVTMKAEQDSLNKTTYDELSEIITEWTSDKNIDMVIGKMEVVFVNESNEITNDILEILKDKNLYTEFENGKVETETETEKVETKNIVVEDLR